MKNQKENILNEIKKSACRLTTNHKEIIRINFFQNFVLIFNTQFNTAIKK